MRVRVVLVGVEGPVNLGLVARTCVNFGVDELYLVSPIASIDEAFLYAARAREYLARARIVDSIDEAIAGSDLVVATTGKGYSRGDYVRQAIDLRSFVNLLKELGLGLVTVLFGRESTGLTRGELLKADYLVTIPANPDYPILNLSQAVAIVLYELWLLKSSGLSSNVAPRAPRSEIESISMLYSELVDRVISDPGKALRIKRVIVRILYRSMPSVYEARLLKYFVRRVLRRIG